jgi:septation ring formation regulator EzrA
MTTQSSVNFYLNWAKERIDEMDAALASLESNLAQMRADYPAKAGQFIADLRKRRDAFEHTVRSHAEASEQSWGSLKVELEKEWAKFEAEVKKYLETFGKDIDQRRAVFQGQIAAQIKAWRETADSVHTAAMQFASERQRDIDATATRMRADAAAAEEKLQKLARAGTESWSAFTAALAETRAVFDRANQAAQEAFKRTATQ